MPLENVGYINTGEFGANAVRELHETIKAFNAATNKQTSQLLFLTWVIVVLTIVMTGTSCLQIWIALRSPAVASKPEVPNIPADLLKE